MIFIEVLPKIETLQMVLFNTVNTFFSIVYKRVSFVDLGSCSIYFYTSAGSENHSISNRINE